MANYKTKSSNPEPHGKPTETDLKIVNTVLRSKGLEPIKSDRIKQDEPPVTSDRSLKVMDAQYLIDKAGYTPDEIMEIVDNPEQLRAALKKGWENLKVEAEQIEHFDKWLMEILGKGATINDAHDPGQPTLAKYEYLANIKMRQVEWLVKDWIPKRAITLIAGQPGVGKTTLALGLVAAVSSGGKWGGVQLKQSNVLIFCGEDTYPEVIKPNLMAAGADPKRVRVLTEGQTYDDAGNLVTEPFNPSKHIAGLNNLIEEISDVGLILLDPALAIAGKARDEYRANDIREALEPVVRLAERHNVAVVAITHFLKRHNASGSNSLDRVLGSQAWGAVARMVLGIEIKGADTRVCARIKSNWGPTGGGFMFNIRVGNVGDGIEGKYVLTGDVVDGAADDLLKVNAKDVSPKLNEAVVFLESYFEHTKESHWNDVVTAGKEAGDMTIKTLRDARERLSESGKLKQIRTGFGKDTKVVWQWQNDDD